MTTPTDPAPVPPPVEPGPAPDWWDETPAQAAAADERWWDDRDYDNEPDDPSDHYYL